MHVDLKAQPITEKEKENARFKKKKKECTNTDSAKYIF